MATRDEIIKKVKSKLEEHTPFDEGLIVPTGQETKPITSYIDSVLEEACDEIHMLLPLNLLTPKSFSAELTKNDGVGIIELPTDYLRLYGLRLSEWERDVVLPISTSNPLYEQQSSKYSRGGFAKPVVALVYSGTKKSFECFSVSDTSTIKKALYIQRVKAEDADNAIIDFIVLMASILVYNIFGETERAKILSVELETKIKIQLQ